jgi:hypothetical protein
MSDNVRKKFALAMVQDAEIYECLVDELRLLGYEVDCYLAFSRRKLSVMDDAINSFLGLWSKIKKHNRLSRLKIKYEKKIIDRMDSYDYGLVIRPDAFGDDFLRKLKTSTDTLVAYQWDGMERYPGVREKIPLFDRFYVFDEEDVKKYPRTLKANNFYFGEIIKKYESRRKKYDAYYLGSFDERVEEVLNLCLELHKRGLKLCIKIPSSRRNRKILGAYSFIDSRKIYYSYKSNLDMASRSEIILDFGHKDIHHGLSFRPFEALGFGVKCITTNASIMKQEFYSESNYLHYTDPSKLDEFLEKKHVENKQRKKYSFADRVDMYVVNGDPTNIGRIQFASAQRKASAKTS